MKSFLCFCAVLRLPCFVRRVQDRRLLACCLALLVLVLRVSCFLQLHLIQVLEVFTDGFEFLVLDAYEIRHFSLHLLQLDRLPAVPPEVIHLLALKADVLLLPQFLDQRQDVFCHLAGPADDIVQILHFPFHELVDVRPQPLQGILVGIHSYLQLLDGFLLLQHSSDELFEADRHEFVLVVLVPVDLFAALVVALQAEEGILFAAFVEAHHPCFLLVHALREVLDLLQQLRGRLSILLFLHSNTIMKPTGSTATLPHARKSDKWRQRGNNAM